VRARVRVEALVDRHLVAPDQPILYEVPFSGNGAQLSLSGVVRTNRPPSRGDTYDVVSRHVDPTPDQLRASARELYPHYVVDNYLRAFTNEPVPTWGTPDRDTTMEGIFDRAALDPRRAGWEEPYRLARRITAGLRTPYDAVTTIEAYFRRYHAYDETVELNTAAGTPLPDWIMSDQGGYCQMFSASMAELVRLLGIPARVAEGFTTGRWDPEERAYHVTDHDAHSWVEVYFPGYGWQPFDPTPSRNLATLASVSSALSSDAFNRISRNVTSALNNPGATPGETPNPQDAGIRSDARFNGIGLTTGKRDDGPAYLTYAGVLLALAAGAGLALVLGKRVVRAYRYRNRDPRRRAAACRADLVSFAADQHVTVAASLTHRQVADVLERDFGVDATRWADLADRARFAPQVRSAVAARELVAETKRVRGDLRDSLAPRSRVQGALSLRSLLPPDL
jgi:transglutaminase-like putative cysteine protease